MSTSLPVVPVIIIWDFDSCTVPANIPISAVVNTLTELGTFYGPIKGINVYGATESIIKSDQKQLRYNKLVNVVDCSDTSLGSRGASPRTELSSRHPSDGTAESQNGSSRCAISDGTELSSAPVPTGTAYIPKPSTSKTKMLTDMFSFVLDHPAPAAIILLSGDDYFSSVIVSLRMRGYTIVNAYPVNVHTTTSGGIHSSATLAVKWHNILTAAAGKEHTKDTVDVPAPSQVPEITAAAVSQDSSSASISTTPMLYTCCCVRCTTPGSIACSVLYCDSITNSSQPSSSANGERVDTATVQRQPGDMMHEFLQACMVLVGANDDKVNPSNHTKSNLVRIPRRQVDQLLHQQIKDRWEVGMVDGLIKEAAKKGYITMKADSATSRGRLSLVLLVNVPVVQRALVVSDHAPPGIPITPSVNKVHRRGYTVQMAYEYVPSKMAHLVPSKLTSQ